MPLHDLRRRTVDDKPTSNIVLSGLEALNRYNIPFGIKSTITYEDFKYIGQSWDDIAKLNEKYDGIHYALTVDYHNIEFEKYKTDIEAGLLEVASKERFFFLEHGYFLSNIFIDSRKRCNSAYMIAMDTDGNVYPCHGSIYAEGNEDLFISNIQRKSFVDDVKRNFYIFNKMNYQNDECSNCIALTCIKCHVKKFECSEKKDFSDRWNDYTSQPELCKFYQLAGKIGRALYRTLQ
jgi:radical SAM protein with 4Fe4S-binding SPASM domain